jgi:hypothetical protein
MGKPVFDKLALYEKAKLRMEREYGSQMLDQAACLYWAECGLVTLFEAGLYPQPQAGTMQWPCVPAEEDDGICNSHFGFQWDPESEVSRNQVRRSLLPEIHIWLALAETHEIVDFSIGNLHKTCERQQPAIKWRTPVPPPFVWGAPPDRVVYHATVEAVRFLYVFVQHHMPESPLTYENVTNHHRRRPAVLSGCQAA